MADNIGKLSIELEARIAKFESDMGRAARIMQRDMVQAAQRNERAIRQMRISAERDMERVRAGAQRAAAAVIGFFGIQQGFRLAKDLAKIADGYANVQAKLRLVTQSSAQLGRVSEQVFQLSQRTFSSLDSTASLVSRTTRALVSNGATAEDALSKSLKLTETIQQAFAVSGATTAEASNAIIQLSQGLAAGALRGEEYNSVAEQGSRITQALAASLNVTTGELRAMAKEGKLTAEVVQKALTDQADAIAAEFAKLPLTIERSFQQLTNAFQRYVGEADAVSGTSAKIADSIQGIAANLPQIISLLTTAATVAAAWFAVYRVGIPLINGVATATTKATASIVAMNVAQEMGIKVAGTWGSRLFAAVGGWPAVIIAAAGAFYTLYDAMAEIEERSLAPLRAIEQINARLREQVEAQRLAAEGVPSEMQASVSQYRQTAEAVENWQRALVEVESQISQVVKNGGPGFTMLSEAAERLREKIARSSEQLREFAILSGLTSTDVVADFRRIAGEGGDALADLVESATKAAQLVGRVFSLGGVDGGAAAQVEFSKETLKTVAALQKQTETFGMVSSELTMYEARLDAAKAATQEESAAILDAAKALSLKQAAQEAEAAAAKNASAAMKLKNAADREAAKATREAARANREYMKWLNEANREIEEIAREQQALADRYAESTRNLQDEISVLQVSGAARQAMIIQLTAERLAREGNNGSIEEAIEHFKELLTTQQQLSEVDSILLNVEDSGFDRLIDDIELVGEALKKATDPEIIERLQNAMGQLQHSMRSAMIDSAKQGLTSLQSMSKEGSKAFAAMQIAIDALSLAQAISAVLNQGQGDPYTAFARMAAMAAAVAALVGSIGSFSGGANTTAVDRQAAQGRGTVLGDAESQSASIAHAVEVTADATQQLVGLNRGMLTALQAMQRGISGASAGIARVDFAELTLDDAAFANAFGPLATIGGALLGSMFGGDQDLVDQGLLVRGGTFGGVSRNPNASSYQTVETDGGWFGSDDIDDELEALGEGVTTQIQLILTSIGDAVREGAEALGLDMAEVNAAIEAFRIEEIRISTMDLTGEEAQAELEAAFSAIFDNLAGAVVPFIDQFQQVGEGLGETLVRVATSVQVTQEAMTQLGLAIGELDPERMAQVSVALIEAAGGIEEFIEGMQSFVANFAPDAHRFSVAQDAITRAFGEVGLTLPDTRDGLWELMQSLDATTESGQRQIATLLRLADTADAYYDHLENSAEAATRAAAAQRAAVDDYADFVHGFDQTGSPFQRSLRQLRSEMQQNIQTANDLARAAGLAGAREQDLALIRESSARQIGELIAGLTQTVIQQIADLYGTSADAIEQRIAAIDAELEALDRSDSGFGMLHNLQREAVLGAERQRQQEQYAEALAEQERVQRRLSALNLAQNLADLGLARGISFEALAAELGLNLDRFGADLGITGEAVGAFIRALEADSLTADVFGDGVQRIVDAITGNDQGPISQGTLPGADDYGGKPGIPPPAPKYLDLDGRVLDKGARDELLIEEIRQLRRENAILLDRVATNTAGSNTELRRIGRAGLYDELNRTRDLGRNSPLAKPKVRA